MKVSLYNVQGFRGYFSYEIDDFVTVINSKHNGVGKTTLYDCLRFLCDTKQLDKEEHKYLLNIKESRGEFSVTVNDVTHGFILDHNSPPIFFRQYDGEERELSNYNIPGVDQDIGVLIINSGIINIISKELNLFSSSAASKDYQLVKAVTTHEETERVLDLLNSSMEYNKLEVASLKQDLALAKAKVTNVPYYLDLDKMESLLNDPRYETLENTLLRVQTKVGAMRPITQLNVNSKFEGLYNVKSLVDRLMPVQIGIPNPAPLTNLSNLRTAVGRLKSSYIPPNANSLDRVYELGKSIFKLNKTNMPSSVSSKPLEQLIDLYKLTRKLGVTETITANTVALNSLVSVRGKISTMLDATRINKENLEQAKILKDNLSDKKVPCPIRKEVYLVDGICHY